MTTLVNGMLILFNGSIELLRAAASPITASLVIAAIGLAWLARIDITEMDRQAAKPVLRRH